MHLEIKVEFTAQNTVANQKKYVWTSVWYLGKEK